MMMIDPLDEAKDICVHLKPLQRLFEDVETADFPDAGRQIGPLMHTVCLVWASSRYYGTPARLVVLLRETCNLLIQQAETFLSPEEILKAEVSESLPKVRAGLEVLRLFRGTYEVCRSDLNRYQRNGRPVNPWDFSPSLVFSRLDRFIDRVKTIEHRRHHSHHHRHHRHHHRHHHHGRPPPQPSPFPSHRNNLLDFGGRASSPVCRAGDPEAIKRRGRESAAGRSAVPTLRRRNAQTHSIKEDEQKRRCWFQGGGKETRFPTFEDLVSVLREVKYLEATQMESIPETAVQIYTTRGQLQQYITNLELIARQYNKVISSLLDVEYPLVHRQLKDVDVQLRRAEESLNWNSEGIWEYIQDVRDCVCDLESRLQRAKDNVDEAQKCARSWASPLFDRREAKKEALICLEDRPERLERFYGL
ncbi:hypothetical protein CRUP_011683, partial [Coryphaenoides rupestris]